MSRELATSHKESETIGGFLCDSGAKLLVAGSVTVIRLLDLCGVLLAIYTCSYCVDIHTLGYRIAPWVM